MRYSYRTFTDILYWNSHISCNVILKMWSLLLSTILITFPVTIGCLIASVNSSWFICNWLFHNSKQGPGVATIEETEAAALVKEIKSTGWPCKLKFWQPVIQCLLLRWLDYRGTSTGIKIHTEMSNLITGSISYIDLVGIFTIPLKQWYTLIESLILIEQSLL